MNDLVVKHFGSVDAAKSYTAAVKRATEGIGGSFDGRDILRLDPEEGFFTFGQEDTELDPQDLIAIHPFSLHHGYIAFENRDIAFTVNGEPAEMLYPATRNLPEFDDLPELETSKKQRAGSRRGGEDRAPEWRYQLAIQMQIVEGPNAGASLIYKPTSLGGQRMIRMIMDEITRRMDEGVEEIVPVVELFSESYKSRTWVGKTIWNPKADIVDWETLDTDSLTAPKAETHPKRDEKTRSGDKVDNRGKAKTTRREPEVYPDEDGNPRATRRQRPSDDDLRAKGREARRSREPEPEPEEETYDDHEPEVEPEVEPDRRATRRTRSEAEPARETARGDRRGARDAGGDDQEPVTRSRRRAARDGAAGEAQDRAPRADRAAGARSERASEPEDGSSDGRNARPARRERNRR